MLGKVFGELRVSAAWVLLGRADRREEARSVQPRRLKAVAVAASFDVADGLALAVLVSM